MFSFDFEIRGHYDPEELKYGVISSVEKMLNVIIGYYYTEKP